MGRAVKPASSFWARGAVLLLALFALLILLERLHTVNEPWFTDVAFYAAMGSEMDQGRPLYSDLWDDRPPASYVTYALAEKVLPAGKGLAFWLGFWFSAATMAGLFVAGKGISGKASGGLWAAGLWALISCESTLEAVQPNIEYFMNACMVWALALLVRRWKQRPPWWAYALIGGLWAWTALYKQFMAVEALGLGLAYVWTAPKGERTGAARGIGLAWGLALAIGAGTFAYFYVTGRGGIFYETLVVYGSYYAGDMALSLLTALSPRYLFPPWLWFAAPLALLSLAAVFLAWRRKSRWTWVFLCFLALKFVEKALPGRLYRHHYYQVWIPALCLGAGWAVVLLAESFQKKRAWVSWVAGGVAALCLTVHQARWFSLPPAEWTRYSYGRDYDGIGQVLQQVSLLLKPAETFFEWAEYPRFYYASGHRVPVGVLFGAHLLAGGTVYSGGPLAGRLADRTLADLEGNRPEMVIWDKAWPPPDWKSNPLSDYLTARYRPFAAFGPGGRFEFWYRVGGQLEGRLKGGTGN